MIDRGTGRPHDGGRRRTTIRIPETLKTRVRRGTRVTGRRNERLIRAFLAVELSDAIRERLAAAARDLRAAGADVTWVSPAAMHLTLKFLGEIPEDRIDSLEALLRISLEPSVRIGGDDFTRPSIGLRKHEIHKTIEAECGETSCRGRTQCVRILAGPDAFYEILKNSLHHPSPGPRLT